MNIPQNDAGGQSPCVINSISKDALAAWYYAQFLPDPGRGYALMNPPGYEAKYTRRHEPVTQDLLFGALNGQSRRTRAGGDWQTVAISIAITPQTSGAKPQAKNIVLDVDQGGRLALIRLLETAKATGLTAFAQCGQSADHDGGHVWLLGAELMPAPMLREIAQRLALAAGVPCETWPTDVDVRLPLMTHVRAPEGAQRFPILLQSGELLTADDVWATVDALRNVPVNTAFAFVTALEKLPPLPIGGGGQRPTHRSKISPGRNESIIKWFNENHDLAALLEATGGAFKSQYTRVICCPYHEDHAPSLAIFRTDAGKDVCRCFSRSSNCPLAAGPYFDAFDLYKLAERLSTVDAIRRLVCEHRFGEKTETIIERLQPEQPVDKMPGLMQAHRQALAAARNRLLSELSNAAKRQGEATVIRATPGLGKTHLAAELANLQHERGRRVAISAPTLEIAETEWLPRLANGYVWRSKLDLCTCHGRAYLQRCMEFGYRYPECTDPECPYARQAIESHGKQIIFQHNHLHLKDGERFKEFDLLIIDESPLAALAPERWVTVTSLERFAEHHQSDVAAPLLCAIARALRGLAESTSDVRGLALESAINRELGQTIDLAMRKARFSKFNTLSPQPPDDPALMTRQFVGPLLKALDAGAYKLSFGRLSDRKQWALVWHERQPIALDTKNSLTQPAIIVLDGSADQIIYDALLRPWPSRIVNIHCDLSPMVEIIQVRCTPSTRHVVKDAGAMVRLARQVAHICNKLDITLHGGVTYAGAVDALQGLLGGQWLHYGGQRGQNSLENAQAVAVVCSPTVPPTAIERKALALWPNLNCTWAPTGRTGEYVSPDARLTALSRFHGAEELRQAVYRVRPLDKEAPVKLIVFTPWDLSLIGLAPALTIDEIANGKSAAVTGSIDAYQNRVFSELSSLQRAGVFQHGINTREDTPHVEKSSKVAVNDSYSNQATQPCPPLSAKNEDLARPFAYPPGTNNQGTTHGHCEPNPPGPGLGAAHTDCGSEQGAPNPHRRQPNHRNQPASRRADQAPKRSARSLRPLATPAGAAAQGLPMVGREPGTIAPG